MRRKVVFMAGIVVLSMLVGALINGTMVQSDKVDFVIDAGGSMDIGVSSTISLEGDRTALINEYIASGAIRGNGIIGNVSATFVNDQTVVAYQPAAQSPMSLRRGITFDRQFYQIPVKPDNVIKPVEVQLVKQMKFDFVKLPINPALMMNSDGTINTDNIWYVDEIVNKFVNK